MIFHTLLSDLCRSMSLPQSYIHKDGLDISTDAFDLHIRQKDNLVTLFIPLNNVLRYSITDMADWPALQLSQCDEQTMLLWSREWLDKLDVEILVDLSIRMFRQAAAITDQGSGTEYASHEMFYPASALR